jgi:iron(III) transport system permease protein
MKKHSLSSAIATTRATFRDPIVAISTVGIIVLLLIFVVWPLLEVVRQSVVGTDGTVSLTAYWKIVSTRQNYQAFINTMKLAIIVSVLATIIGFLFAYCTSHLDIPGKKAFSLMAMLPMVSPPFSVAMSIIMLFGARGLITYTMLGMRDANIYGFTGLVFTQTISYFPIAYLLLAGMLRSIDPVD